MMRMSKSAGTVETMPWQCRPSFVVAGPKSAHDELKTGHSHLMLPPSVQQGAVMHAAHGLAGHGICGVWPLTASHHPAQLNVDTIPASVALPPNTLCCATALQTGASFTAQPFLHCCCVAALMVEFRISAIETV